MQHMYWYQMESQSPASLDWEDLIGSNDELDYPDVRHLIDLSTATDPEIIDCLRRVTKRHESAPATAEVNPHLASLHPSELPPCFVAAGPRWTSSPTSTKEKSWRTPRGTWKEKRRGYTAVRDGVVMTSAPSPRYVGVKRVMEFHTHSGAKTGWNMIKYHALHNLVIEDKMAFCKVFQLKKGDAKQHYQQVPAHLLVAGSSSSRQATTFFQDVDELMMNNFKAIEHPIYGDMQIPGEDKSNMSSPNEEEEAVPLPGGPGGREDKRSRSGVWEQFTRIHTTTKDGQDVDVYAACHSCDGMLRAGGKKHGTSRLKRHYENTCPSNHPPAPAAPTNLAFTLIKVTT